MCGFMEMARDVGNIDCISDHVDIKTIIFGSASMSRSTLAMAKILVGGRLRFILNPTTNFVDYFVWVNFPAENVCSHVCLLALWRPLW